MVRNHQLYITVPNFFKCPISLDVMKSPVSLCTGVTYDRSSIQKWLDNGNNTCPATMQILQSKDFVPNLTLRRLIRTWSDNFENPSSQQAQDDLHLSQNPCSNSIISAQQARDLIRKIERSSRDGSCFGSLSKIADFAADSDGNRKFVANIDGFVPLLVEIVSNGGTNKIGFSEQTIRVLDMILIDCPNKEDLMRSMARNQGFLQSILLVLQKGNSDSKVRSARVLETVATTDPESKLLIGEEEGVLFELIGMIGMSSSSSSESTDDSSRAMMMIEAGLSCLIALSSPRRNRLKMVRLGSVQKLGKILSDSDSKVCTVEKVLKLLEIISNCTEGRTSICKDELCVRWIVQRMLKVSNAATEHAVVILWSVCYLFRDEKAQENVVKSSNGLSKILLLMQSNCSTSARQMCGDLLKIFRVNSKSCLSSYETKTTHIMPF